MDFKNNSKGNQGSRPGSSSNRHYMEANTAHISVENTSPFRKPSGCSTPDKSLYKKTSVLSKRQPKNACSSATSKLLVNQIIRDDLNIDKQRNYDQHLVSIDLESKTSATSINSKTFSLRHGLRSRRESVAITKSSRQIPDYNSISDTTFSNEEKHYAEKSTYCRPVINYRNNDFLNKTIKRNNKLEKLVKKLISSRKEERESESWNNYINELKNRHHFNKSEVIINDKQNACNYASEHIIQSDPRENLTHDIYHAQNYDLPWQLPSYDVYPYCTYSNCYPISAQGRLILLNKEKGKQNFAYDWNYRPKLGRIVVDRECVKNRQSRNDLNESTRCKNIKIQLTKNKLLKNTATVQTTQEQRGCNTESLKSQYNIVSENVERLRTQMQGMPSVNITNNILYNIENKLDSLIMSLNKFMENVKPKSSESQFCDCTSENLDPTENKNAKLKSETVGILKANRLICDKNSTNRQKPLFTENMSCKTSIEKLIIKELENSNQVKRDIENLLGKKAITCAVQIEIPTKETSTEVTKSLSKYAINLNNKSASVVDVRNDLGEAKKNAMAVNTEPLGLLGLLRVSTEALKQFLSYMPNLPCQWYLPAALSYPQSKLCSHFICNICGAAFKKPSQLSDHVQGHHLGKVRDCCVCRHILDLQSRRPQGLFRCQYCGQCFTRAYCCELHQESCARSLGRTHDATPSLLVLR